MSAPGSVLKRRKAAATYGKRVSRASYTGQSSSFTSGSSSLQVPKSHPKCNAELETYELSPEPSSSSEEENTGRQPRLDSADPTIEGQRQQTPVDDAQALSKATEKDLPADSIPEHSTKRRKLVHRMASRSSSATASPVKGQRAIFHVGVSLKLTLHPFT